MLTDKEINALCRDIAMETLDPTEDELELLELEELQKQYEFMQYAEDQADLDAEYYGVAK